MRTVEEIFDEKGILSYTQQQTSEPSFPNSEYKGLLNSSWVSSGFY